MDEIVHRISAWDMLPLTVHEWRDGNEHAPILCLPGLVRTGRDFASVARVLGKGRRVVAPDYPGRGASGRTRKYRRYGPEACVRDVLDVCVALHVHHAVVIGTSFGGLLAMAIAVARHTVLRAVVLNDIGPDVGQGGAEFVKRFVSLDPALPDIDAAAAFLRANLPPMSLKTDEDCEPWCV